MPDQFIIFTYPSWWLIPQALLAGLLSWMLYSKKGYPWSKTMNWVLASMRFLVFFILFGLFLDPIANLIIHDEEKPIVAIAVDNSTSTLLNNDSSEIITSVNRLVQLSESKGYNVQLFDLHDKVDSETLVFDATSTNLNQQLKQIERAFENQNLAAIVQITDGIVNYGYIPSRSAFGQAVYTLGVGDTIAPKDINIVSVDANNIVYQGNLFKAKVLLTATGFEGQNITIEVLQNGSKVASQETTLSRNKELEITLNADKAGLFRYTILAQQLEGESLTKNNEFEFYVDVIEGKENILIAAPYPHPDIRAIRAALSKSENYQTHLYIPDLEPLDVTIQYDVVILHNAFGRQRTRLNLENLLDIPILYLVNERPDMARMANVTSIQLKEYNNQTDAITPSYNEAFSKFNLSSDLIERFGDFPTVPVPYAQYQLNGPQEILLRQQVGRISTQKPLLSFYDDGSKKFATFMSTGIWKWRLQEAALSDQTSLFDELIQKTIQFLSIRNDKKRFSVIPSERMFDEGTPVSFKVELYNKIYERIGGAPFKISILSEDSSENNFDFTTSDRLNQFEIGNFDAGTYDFAAQTVLDGQMETVTGQFIVKKVQLENLQQQADHQMLRALSQNSGGRYFHISEIDKLMDHLAESDYPGIIRSENDFVPVRKSTWVLVLLILLSTIEWFLRKYLGSY